MSPASLRRGSSVRTVSCFVVGLARRAERAEHAGPRPSPCRTRAGRPRRRAGSGRRRLSGWRRCAGVRCARACSSASLKAATVSGGGGGSGVFGRGDPAEIVVDGHVAAAEGDAEPQRRREAAVRAGVLRVGGDRLAERGERLVAIEVVDLVGRLAPGAPRIPGWRAAGAAAAATSSAAGDGETRSGGRAYADILRRAVACAACAFCIQSPPQFNWGKTSLGRESALDNVANLGTAHGARSRARTRASRGARLLAQVRLLASTTRSSASSTR